MGKPLESTPIVVRGELDQAANGIINMINFWGLASATPPGVNMLFPPIGFVPETVVIAWHGTNPIKYQLAMTQMEALANSYSSTMVLIGIPSDTSTLAFGPSSLTGLELRTAFFALKRIELNEDIYLRGYGGSNFGSLLKIGYSAAAGYGSRGEGGYNYLLLHELVHNTLKGRAIVQQMFDRHLNQPGNTPGNYDVSSPFFIEQEQMTNSLAKQLADQIGVNINSNLPNDNWPPLGYYTGLELQP